MFKFDTVLYQFLETGTSDITFKGHDQELKWLAFKAYTPFQFSRTVPLILNIFLRHRTFLRYKLFHVNAVYLDLASEFRNKTHNVYHMPLLCRAESGDAFVKFVSLGYFLKISLYQSFEVVWFSSFLWLVTVAVGLLASFKNKFELKQSYNELFYFSQQSLLFLKLYNL